MSIERLRKRDGRLEPFDSSKIARAIRGSMRELGRDDPARADALAQRLVVLLEIASPGRTPSVEQVQDLVERVLVEDGDPDLAKAYILHRFRHAALRQAKTAIGVKDDMKLSLNAIRVLEKRYLRKDEKGQIIESPSQMFRRVAEAVAAVDARYEGDASARESAETFYQMMSSLDFLPNSPTLMNAGTEMGQLSACFVLPVDDSMDGIFSALRNMAFIHQSGGGTGFSFSRLRPSGDVVRSTGGVASGPISFIEVFDKATDVIKQGGRRRGANMAILSINHADALEFILCKTRPGFLSNFNISVAITDKFMAAVHSGGEHAFLNPRSGEVVERRPAREVFDLICSSAWQCGDPGLVFIDEINRANPLAGVALIEATNPCVTGETWIQTEEGPRPVRDLVDRPFTARVNGQPCASGPRGFFRTGTKPVVRLITDEGYALRLTPDHRVRRVVRKTRYAIEHEWCAAEALRPGDEIALSDHRESPAWPGAYTWEQGYVMGLLLGDGMLKREKDVPANAVCRAGALAGHPFAAEGGCATPTLAETEGPGLASLRDMAFDCGVAPGATAITQVMEQASSAFCRGFLRGMFDTDGAVLDQPEGASVRLSHPDRLSLEAVQRMLLRMGMVSRLEQCGAGAPACHTFAAEGGCATHELVIAGDNLARFDELVGFSDSAKSERLSRLLASYARRLNRERFTARVQSVLPDGIEDVYDVQIPGVHAFDANGLLAHNCGEQPLLPYESCNLGSLNLARFVREDGFDFDRLGPTVDNAVHFLDNVIDANRYPIPAIADATLGSRKIGLGVMGWSDALYRMNVAYDSDEALRRAEEVMAFIARRGREMSAALAVRRGAFPFFEQSRWKQAGGPPLRNATVTTVAPTGTIGLIAAVSSGIEPVFALRFWRTMAEGATLFETHPEFARRAEALGLDLEELFGGCAREGSIRACETLPEELRRVFVVARDISPERHVRMQAAFQRHSDNGVSKTINLPRTATVQDIRGAYLLAHELRCKGITVYREGSKEGEVLRAGAPAARRDHIPTLSEGTCDPREGVCLRCPG